jgi:hypothetical protein
MLLCRLSLHRHIEATVMAYAREAYWRGRLSTVDLLIKAACFVKKINYIFHIKMIWSKLVSARRSTVLSLPPLVRIPCLNLPWLLGHCDNNLKHVICCLIAQGTKVTTAMELLSFRRWCCIIEPVKKSVYVSKGIILICSRTGYSKPVLYRLSIATASPAVFHCHCCFCMMILRPILRVSMHL